ncbi:MAG: ADP-forming succinate--CoA ligase subunit beta [Candidatus Nealsonbacteria bacterium]|nr:ADP-forming succinate--CoA ligase subunit beta [Candidatus Nealsonbacteria bacterium]
MKIHEYQAKEIFKEYGIPIPRGRVADSLREAEIIAQELGFPVMVKAQITAGGRGKAGGVKEAAGLEELIMVTSQMLGHRLATAQTSAEGLMVDKVLVQEKLGIKKEFYLAITVDRQKECPVIVFCPSGGASIEEVAKEHPERIYKEYIDPVKGFIDFHGVKADMMPVASALWRVFKERECLLVEINPLVLAEDDKLYALDAKIVFDDNALFRQLENQKFSDVSELNYIKLDGNIGCMVNGAGLAMASMDTIKLFGGEPANFLDVGGGADPEKIRRAFQVIAEDPEVKAVFINIFGGISRCDLVAQGVSMAFQNKKIDLPLIVRFEGTNAKEGFQILKKSGIRFQKASSLTDGAKLAIGAVR